MIEGYYAVDYQVHSLRSHDGKASIMEHCARAVAMGLDEIGFSEHKDFDPEDPNVNHFDYDAYMKEISEARQHWGPRLKIRAGVEIDYQVWFEDKIANYLDRHPFDFVLGSVHYVRRVPIMSSEYNQKRNARLAYADYFHAVRDSVVSGLFDILSHMEYANRRGIAAWGPYNTRAHINDLNTIFDRMIDEEMTLEINTGGLHQGVGVTYPCEDTLELFVRRGGRHISFGSDAHHPDQLAYGYAQAMRMAESYGLNKISTYENRQRREVPVKAARAVAV